MPGSTRAAIRYPATIFLSAFLLFQVQPMLGRYVLPWFGGGPAVWTVCLLFFQLMLVAGYAYSHWLGSLRNAKLQARIHIGMLLVSLAFLPVTPNADIWRTPSSADPAGRLLLLLAATIGAPYLLLAATGPLLQRWLITEDSQRTPWRLYALSNAGSLLALLTYPIAVEPYLRLRTQTWIWSSLYGVFAILSAFTAWRSTARPASAPSTRPDAASVLFWIGLSAAGSTLLLATTNEISEKVAATPFLWIAPLAIYLVTFILTFQSERWYRRPVVASGAGIITAVAAVILLGGTTDVSLKWQFSLYLATLFVVCMACHGELVRSRPEAGSLTTFYLAIAIGGALGGMFVALAAPALFHVYSEYPIGLTAACALIFAAWLRDGAWRQWTGGNLAVRIPLMALLVGGCAAVNAAWVDANRLATASMRNFYGILRVIDRNDEVGVPYRELMHGPIRHGFQYLSVGKRTMPTSYYGPHSGVGVVLNALEPARRVAVIGLGTGTLAAWGRPGDTFRFYEINPAVEQIARNWFTFLGDSKARVEVVGGDARVRLEAELSQGRSQDFDVIAVDAFSGDNIPLHLLTAESGDVYKRHLAPGGCLLLHISNRSVDLDPIARGLAEHLGWKAALFVSGPREDTGESASHWVLITANEELLHSPLVAPKVSIRKISPGSRPVLWTDDFASLWEILKL